MGWFRDDAPGCEGYVRGLIREDGRMVELGYPDERPDVKRPHEIQVECECGWRSPRMPAPLSAEWSPFAVFMREEDEDAAAAIWAEHIAELAGRDPHEALWQRAKRARVTNAGSGEGQERE